MSWSSPKLPAIGLILAVAVGLPLAGCTVSPVYSDVALAEQNLALSYDRPSNRLSELLYQDLKVRFPPQAGPSTVQISVNVTTNATVITRSKSNNVVRNREMNATARIRLVDEGGKGKIILATTRTVTVPFTTNGQVLADQEATEAAQEQAAHALAETVRLTVLAQLAG